MKRPPTFLIFVGLFFLKLSLLFWSAHPFDFWSFVNVVHRGTAFGWNIFEYWNKGGLLLWVWYPLYNAYLFILNSLGSSTDNLLLIHFLFKVPFLMLDLVCALLIHKITASLTGDSRRAAVASLLWYVNPIVFYVYGIHGHYELLTAFGIILMVWGLVARKPVLTAVGFIVGFTTKYFLVIFLPFVILYFLGFGKGKCAVSLALFLGMLLGGVSLSYGHLFVFPQIREQAMESILHLSGMGSDGLSARTDERALESVPKLSGFFLVGNFFVPRELQEDFVNIFSGHWYVFSFLFLFVLFMCRVLLVFRSKTYESASVLKDLFLALMIFLFFLRNSQPHYLIWVISLAIPIAFLFSSKKRRILLLIFSFLTLFGFIFSFKSEQGPGTFFLDFGIYNKTVTWEPRHHTMALYGSGVSLSILFLAFFVSRFSSEREFVRSSIGKAWRFEYFLPISISVFTWLFIASVFVPNCFSYLKHREAIEEGISIPSNSYRNPIINGYYPIESIDVDQGNIVMSRRSTNNSLVIENLADNEKLKHDEIDSYLAVRKEVASSGELLIARFPKQYNFNGCAIKYSEDSPPSNRNFKATNYYFFHVPTECVQKENSLHSAFLGSGIDWSEKDMILVILSNESGVSFSSFSRGVAFLGALYATFFLFGSFLILGLIRRIIRANI